MNRILLIEDNGALSRDLKEKLEPIGYDVKKAYSYMSAIGMWKKYKGEFICIILDLNISPEGLESQENSRLFPLNGLAFLHEISRDKEGHEKQEIIDKIIIYSGYINELRQLSRAINLKIDNLILVSKSGTNIRKLIKLIQEKYKI